MKLKKTSVIFQIIMSLLTAGLYIPIWFLARIKNINEMDSDRELNAGIFVAVGFYLFFRYVLFLYALSRGTGFSLIIETMQKDPIEFICMLIMLVQALKTRLILLDHFQNEKIFWLLTLLLGIFYLQYKINRFKG